jgi:hypothetical protein
MMMRHVVAWSGLLTATLVLASAAAAQDPAPPKQKDKGPQHGRVATPEDYKALAKKKEVTGRLFSVDGTDQLTLKVDWQAYEPRDTAAKLSPQNNRAQRQLQQALAKQQRLMQQLQQAQLTRNPSQRQQRVAQLTAQLEAVQANAAALQQTIANDPNNGPYKAVTKSVEFQLPIVANVKVAKAKLDVEYDDKGKIKEPTAEELKKKKSPDMPGYKATFEDVQPGELVTVYLGKSKAEEAKARKEKDKSGKKAEDKADAGKEKAGADAKPGAADASRDAPKAPPEPDKAKAADAPKDAAKAKAGDAPKAPAIVLDKEKDKAAPALNPEEDDRPQVRMILILTDPDPATLPRDLSRGNRQKKGQ